MKPIEAHKKNHYEVIIIGAGAAGLFCGANIKLRGKNKRGLILEKTNTCGQKILLSGGGQCNITNGEDIKNFVNRYGANGKKIRNCLYSFSNKALVEYLESNGIKTITREDGKIFPKSMEAKDIRDMLVEKAEKNGFTFEKNQSVASFKKTKEGEFCVNEKWYCKFLVIATGGKTYPGTGSDGQFYKVIKGAKIKVTNLEEGLTPIKIKSDPFEKLSGVALKNIRGQALESNNKLISKGQGDILFTGEMLSGPLILNLSRDLGREKKIKLFFCDEEKTKESLLQEGKRSPLDTEKSRRSITGFLVEKTGLPKRLVEALLASLGIKPNEKASGVHEKRLRPFVEGFLFEIEKKEERGLGMVTVGGVALEEVDGKSFEAKAMKNLFFIGEVVDIDGETGGYNLQFACSSGHSAAKAIEKVV